MKLLLWVFMAILVGIGGAEANSQSAVKKVIPLPSNPQGRFNIVGAFDNEGDNTLVDIKIEACNHLFTFTFKKADLVEDKRYEIRKIIFIELEKICGKNL